MKKLKLFLVCLLAIVSTALQAQNITVKGQVSSADGEPVVGAYALLKGTTNG